MRAVVRTPAETVPSTVVRTLAVQMTLVGCAWLTLLLIHASPYATYFGHGVLGESSVSPPTALGLFATGWLLMLLAMMVPGALPDLLRAVARGSRASSWLAGNLAPWMLFGFAFAAADLVVHSVIAPRFPLAAAGAPVWLWLAAGTYHLIVMAPRDRGAAARAERRAFLLGWRAGSRCLGTDWLLMLAVAGSHDQLLVMAAATVVMGSRSYVGLPRWCHALVALGMVTLGMAATAG